MTTELWCVHITGPDDLIPASDFATAELWAGKANRRLKEMLGKNPSPNDPQMKAEVMLWPYSPEGHAEGVSEEYKWITE